MSALYFGKMGVQEERSKDSGKLKKQNNVTLSVTTELKGTTISREP